MPYGVDSGAWCGMEVVLPNGEVLRTGMGAMPGNKAVALLQAQPRPVARTCCSRSPTTASSRRWAYWLMPEPEAYMPLWLRLPKDDDLAVATDVMRTLMLDDTLRMNPQIMSGTLLAAVLSERSTHWDDPDHADPPGRPATGWARSCGSGAGSCASRSTATTPSSTTATRRSRTRSSPRSRARRSGARSTRPDQIADIEDPSERVQGGVPSLDLNAMTGWYGGEQGGHIGFSPVLPMTGEDALRVRDLMRREMEAIGLDYMAALIPINARRMVHVTMVIFDTASVEQSEKAYARVPACGPAAAKEGYGEYRAHLDFMDLATEQYSFGDHAQRRFNETIKDALDPNGILSPGQAEHLARAGCASSRGYGERVEGAGA